MKQSFLVQALLAAPALAQVTIHVPADQPTIQAAIHIATDGDTVLVAPGTYHEQLDTLGKAIAVRSSDGAEATVIDSLGQEAWLDYPWGSVIRMTNGETSTTVIEGFTIQGANRDTTGPGVSGIWCEGLDPTIVDCIVTNNRGERGAGIHGNAFIDGCQILQNDSEYGYEGGGLWGQPTVTHSIIADNYAGHRGGGLFATGPCTVTDSIIDANEAGDGFNGYSGGGVYGPATLVRCIITNNIAHHTQTGGPPNAVGTALDQVAAMTRCTLVNNRLGVWWPEDPAGALRGSTVVNSCILWDNMNDVLDTVAADSAPTIHHSILPEAFPGVGNLTADPLLNDPSSGDYGLQSTSPAVDAGDPALPPDPDGTVADIGALFLDQTPAGAIVVNGTGVNPLSLQTASVPAFGTTWTASLDASLHGPGTFAAGLVGVLSPAAPLATSFGELLVNPSAPTVIEMTANVLSGVASFSVPVPTAIDLLGTQVHTQGFAINTTVELANGITLTIGY